MTGRARRLARRVLVACALLSPAAGCASARLASVAGDATTVIVVRHAERSADDPTDPTLSAAGRVRAAALRRAVAGADVRAVFATQYRRTRETGGAVADGHGIEVTVRPITAANASSYASELAREILAGHAGGTVLVIGHNNTVPDMLRALGVGEIEPIPESEYDRMYVAVLDACGARLVAATYGSPTD